MRKIYFLLVFLFFRAEFSNGQDIHFTQFYFSALTLNPALTGDIEGGNLRYTGNYRNQWYTIVSPYVTTAIAVDAKLMEERLHGDALGLGFIFINDRSGAAALNNLQFQMSASYKKYFDANKTHLASFGVQAGFFQKKIDMNKLNFGSQYQAGNFDNTLSSGESFSDLKKSNLDFNAGLVYSYSPEKKLKNIKAGICLFHINTPNESLSGNIDEISMRSSFFIESRIQLQEDFFLCPKILQMNQKEAAESNVSLLVEKRLQNTEDKKTSLLIGTGVRVSDAYLFMAGMKYNNWQFMLSYDVNSSELSKATNSQGAIEFSLIYHELVIPGKNKLPVLEPCPRM